MEEGGRGKTPRSTCVSTLCLRCGPRTPNSQQNAAGVAPSPTAGGRLNCSPSPDGCSETIMLARGFTVEQMLELVHAGLATTNGERVAMGARTIEVARVRITEAGRSTLSRRRKAGLQYRGAE